MKIALLELPARWGDPAAVLQQARALLERGPCDLALLPECALTGYVSGGGDFDLARFAEPAATSSQLAALRQLARDAGCTVAGPSIEADGDACFNAFVVVSPSGEVVARYRKRHPWYPETWATAGADPHPSFDVAGVSCTIAICFDLHFLQEEASELLATRDLLLFPSAWVDDQPSDGRAPIFDRLAERFGIAIANANWGAGTPAIRGQGRSRLVLPTGEVHVAARGSGRLDAEVTGRARA